MDLSTIDLLILDVDGVLTPGDVFCQEEGDLARTFNIQDGCGIKLWHRCGGRSALVSGRQTPVVDRRARKLGIETVLQGTADKLSAYRNVLTANAAGDEQVCYLGDDLPDLGPMGRCRFPVAVANAVPAVKQAAQYVTRRPGGRGAVAELIELILRKQRRWAPV
ncbi:MAG TPA: HAD hydrolase family protein [Phycisphaerae bacterium]|nr:HAD hydrolase family protein [Phycisphaerae bacterium]